MSKFVCHVEIDNVKWTRDIYVVQIRDERPFAYLTIDTDGMARLVQMVDMGAIPLPLFRLDGSADAHMILQAFAEGLKAKGFVVEVDNAERITAQALADERLKEIQYLRGHVDAAVRKALQ